MLQPGPPRRFPALGSTSPKYHSVDHHTCSIAIGTGWLHTEPGSVQALHLVVDDIQVARVELAARGVDVKEVEVVSAPGKPDVTYAWFTDLDDSGWTLQQIA